jgi:hypothetical protein
MRYALWMKKANIHALDGYTNGHGTQPRTTQIVRVPGCDTFQGRFLLMLIPKHQETILRSQQKISIIFNYLIWLVVWNIFSPIVGMMIQSDFHIFQRGWSHQPVIITTHQGTIESHQSDVGYRSFLSGYPSGGRSARLETEEPAAPAEARTGKIWDLGSVW